MLWPLPPLILFLFVFSILFFRLSVFGCFQVPFDSGSESWPSVARSNASTSIWQWHLGKVFFSLSLSFISLILRFKKICICINIYIKQMKYIYLCIWFFFCGHLISLGSECFCGFFLSPSSFGWCIITDIIYTQIFFPPVAFFLCAI